MSIRIVDYTDKSCIVIGDTFSLKDQLKAKGGRWQPNLRKMPEVATKGWLFPLTKKAELEKLIETQQVSINNQKDANQASNIVLHVNLPTEIIEKVDNVEQINNDHDGYVTIIKKITRIEKYKINN